MPAPLATPKRFDRIENKIDRINDKIDAQGQMLTAPVAAIGVTAPVAAIGTIVGVLVAVGVVAAGISLEKSVATVLARAQVPVSRESAPLSVEAPSASTTIAVASPFPAWD